MGALIPLRLQVGIRIQEKLIKYGVRFIHLFSIFPPLISPSSVRAEVFILIRFPLNCFSSDSQTV